jgi:hypothetical protein
MAETSHRRRLRQTPALRAGVDSCSPWVRRCKDIIRAHLVDLGGEDASAAERSIIRRAAVLTTELERLEVKLSLRWPTRQLRMISTFTSAQQTV